MRISNHNPYLYIEQCTRFTSLPAICKQLKFVVDVCWPFFPIFCLSYVMPPKVTLSYRLKLEILNYAKKTSISEASRKYAVERQNIRKWKLKEAEMRAFLKFCKPQKFFEVCLCQWFFYIYNPPKKEPFLPDALKKKEPGFLFRILR